MEKSQIEPSPASAKITSVTLLVGTAGILQCEIAGMKPINIEKLMNHSTGISDSYYRATENELLEDYLKAVEMLTINDDKLTIQKQVAELTEKSKEENHVIKGKLSDREKEIQLLRLRDSMNTDAIATLSDQLAKVMQEIEMIKKNLI